MERRVASSEAVELLNQHRRLTSRLARRLGRSDAEDLASEALARSLRRPAPDGSRQPWLERILRNLVVDRARRSRSAAVHAAELSRTTDAGAAPNPEEHLLSDERRRAVEDALPAMPSGLREAVLGRFYEERDYDDVAAARGISPATARTRVHRALASLRVSLGRLRAAVPLPSLFGGAHSFSATAALLPAALSAALVVPALAGGPSSLVSADVGAVLVAQASPRVRTRGPSVEPIARPEAAPVAAPSTPVPKPARAGTAPRTQAPPAPPTEDKPAAVTKYDFEGDQVEGILARPDGEPVVGDTAVKHASLIEIRREFVSEIAKMLEDI